MVSRHLRTLTAVFEDPVRANILWSDIESMLRYLGAEFAERSGSRVNVRLNGFGVVLHRPHPRKEANRYTVRDVRAFLTLVGVTP
jgi:hypothetical protein